MKGIFNFLFLVLIVSSCAKDQSPLTKSCFSYSPANPIAGDDITFDASCSKNVSGYIWRIDGLLSNVYSNKAKFTQSFNPGSHQITLIIAGKDNKSDSMQLSLNLVGLSPVACFTVTDPNSTNLTYPVNTQITFDGSCSANADFNSAQWNLGNGFNAYGQTATAIYTKKGTYTVYYTVTNSSHAGSNSCYKTITIN
jgi:PKD repeat protein